MIDKTNNEAPIGLYWKGKRTEVDSIGLPFQYIEIVNESRATREKERGTFSALQTKPDTSWYNRLIWGDNKYIMASLLEEFAGKIDLIYIDPPFATGSDFSIKITVGDTIWIKEPSAIEDKAYRDTWGKGLDSYLQMMYERLVLMRNLLSPKGSIYVHLDWHAGEYVKILLDEIFGKDNFRNEISWHYRTGNLSKNQFQRKHDNIYFYSKSDEIVFNPLEEKEYYSDIYGADFKPSFEGRKQGKDSKGIYRMSMVDDVWNISAVFTLSNEHLPYDTQKPEALLERIMQASSNQGDLVADFFCGSGTTGAVAEKLGRRWVMADLSRYAIHTSRKRLLDIDQCKPFIVQNLGKYERQYWQGITFKKHSSEQIPIYDYIEFVLNLYNAEPLTGMMHIHGKKGKRLVHIGAVDAPVTLSEIKETITEVKKIGQNTLDILGWEWEMGLHDVVEKEAKTEGLSLHLFNIPRDVMDPRAVEKGEITFFELAYLEVEVKESATQVMIELKDFAIPNLDLIPEDVRNKIKKWSDYIDYWAVDWDWNEDTFHNMWQSYRARKDRTLELKTDWYAYEKKGRHSVMIKVIDVFGNDTTRIAEVNT